MIDAEAIAQLIRHTFASRELTQWTLTGGRRQLLNSDIDTLAADIADALNSTNRDDESTGGETDDASGSSSRAQVAGSAATSAPASLAAILAQIEAVDLDYAARYGLVLDALAAGHRAGIPAGIAIDAAYPEWPVVYLELPTGQVSWHMPAHTVPWDGHTTGEKYGRVRAYVAEAGGDRG